MTSKPSQAALAARERRVRKGRDQEAAASRRSLQSMIEMPLLEALAERGEPPGLAISMATLPNA